MGSVVPNKTIFMCDGPIYLYYICKYIDRLITSIILPAVCDILFCILCIISRRVSSSRNIRHLLLKLYISLLFLS
jgi:hypothetical protein